MKQESVWGCPTPSTVGKESLHFLEGVHSYKRCGQTVDTYFGTLDKSDVPGPTVEEHVLEAFFAASSDWVERSMRLVSSRSIVLKWQASLDLELEDYDPELDGSNGSFGRLWESLTGNKARDRRDLTDWRKMSFKLLHAIIDPDVDIDSLFTYGGLFSLLSHFYTTSRCSPSSCGVGLDASAQKKKISSFLLKGTRF